jgi:hypothetical protein
MALKTLNIKSNLNVIGQITENHTLQQQTEYDTGKVFDGKKVYGRL